MGTRAVFVVALSGLTLASGVIEAQARGFRLRSGGSRFTSPSPAPTPSRLAIVGLPGWRSTGPSYGEPRESTVVTRSVLSAEAQPQNAEEALSATPAPAAEPAKVTKVAEPWCRSGRVTGQGKGFCLIN